MNTFYLANGNKLIYPDIEQIDDNLVRVHINFSDDTCGERVWAHVSPSDLFLYDNDNLRDIYIICRLANNPLFLSLQRGDYVVATLQGYLIPEVSLKDVEYHYNKTRGQKTDG